MANSRVLSLKKSCIEVLASDFDALLDICDRDENSTLKPLLQKTLTSALCRKTNYLLRKRHASFLINPHLQVVNLNHFSAEDIDEVIKILQRQGKDILTVFLSAEERCYQESFLIQLAHSLPSNLRSLFLVETQCSGEVLKIVAEGCSNLQELILHGCSRVTDASIAAMIFNGGQSINNTLTKLDLTLTSVTMLGIVSILDNCPNLTEILHHYVNNAVSYIYKRYFETNNVPFRKYNLKTLYIENKYLEAAQTMFPNVRIITVYGLQTQGQVNICKKFEKLEKVTFTCFEPVLLSPFLEMRGSTLKALSISGNMLVPVESIIQFCPKIKSLSLFNVNLGGGQSIDLARFSLQNLIYLLINHVNLETEIQSINTLFAFSPNVQTFSFQCVSGFSEAVVNTITAHGLPCLSELIFFNTNVDMNTIRKFIMVSPNLKFISICRSESISKNECEVLEQLKSSLRIIYDR